MSEKQTTIKKPVSLKGVGLHTGKKVELTIKPAPADHWYRFVRTDIDGKPEIRAVAENVVETSRGTTISENNAKVSTIEHLLSAAYGLGVDNLLLELDGPEVPIMDGSARYWVEALNNAGLKELDEDRLIIDIKEKKQFEEREKEIDLCLYPDNDFRLNVLVDYKSTELVNQFASLDNLKDFTTKVAPCRTFAFLSELEPLFKAGLIKGGDLDNAVVLVDKTYSEDEFSRLASIFNKPDIKVKTHGVLNNTDLHFINEPARHKLLDLIGDLALVGYRIKGNIIAKRPGHHANVKLAGTIRNYIINEIKKPKIPQYDPDAKPLMDTNEIKKRLPHRSPFLFVDKILRLSQREVVGIKNVTLDEPFFAGHFPDQPVMPGVLQIEAMAQVGGILVLGTVEDPENYLTYFLKIDKVKFRKRVTPGDTMIMELFLLDEIRRGIAYMKGEAYVGNTLVCEAELTAQIVKVKTK